MTRISNRSLSAALIAASLTLALPVHVFAADTGLVPDEARVAELARLLPAERHGVGRPITDRQAWEKLASAKGFREVIEQAESLLGQPIPPLTDDLYLDFSRTGNRTRCQRVLSNRHGRVTTLVLAECLEDKGRFLPAIEKTILEVCGEKTWVLPAHDRSLRNFRGEVNEIDLTVAGFSWELATAAWWLGDRLSQPVRRRMMEELERRTLRPFEAAIRTGEPRLWWLTGTNNWNAVCLAGVTGTALATIDDPERRAFFVGAAEKSIQYFLKGFTPDGYCSEGIGYWNYGFGHFIVLSETLLQATDGQLDWFQWPQIEPISSFALRMEILPGIYPSFADCSYGSQPSERWLAYLSRRYGWGLREIEQRGLALGSGPSSSLVATGLLDFPNTVTHRPAARDGHQQRSVRDWFSDAQVLICRPARSGQDALAVAIKGGHNAEHHNHNDVGTFVVALGEHCPLIDPGSEVYTARTFSSRRYESDLLNSFGHPVPRVAGQLQRPGRQAAARVVEQSFADDQDVLVLDLAKAYSVDILQQLERRFVYDRRQSGRLIVEDRVEFSEPADFGTALISFDKPRSVGNGVWRFGSSASAVNVTISCDVGEFKTSVEQIDEDIRADRKPYRFGIDMVEPVREATIKLIIEPAAKS